jgi:hypothetical protein
VHCDEACFPDLHIDLTRLRFHDTPLFAFTEDAASENLKPVF